MLPGRSSTVSCAVPKERACSPFRRSGIEATEPPRRLRGLPSKVHAALHSQIRCISVEKRIVVSNCFLDERTIAKSLTALSPFRNLGPAARGIYGDPGASGSSPIRSFTALWKRCLQPRYRSVVCTETCPNIIQNVVNEPIGGESP